MGTHWRRQDDVGSVPYRANKSIDICAYYNGRAQRPSPTVFSVNIRLCISVREGTETLPYKVVVKHKLEQTERFFSLLRMTNHYTPAVILNAVKDPDGCTDSV